MSDDTTPRDIIVSFLQDSGQPPGSVAIKLAAFLSQAMTTLDIAIYDFVLSPLLAATIKGAVRAALTRGVHIRLVYEAGHTDPSNGPPPPGSTAEFVAELGVEARPIATYRALMHHKYVVRDAGAAQAAVWTGSTNWTDDAWGREENVILEISSLALASHYARDFEALWEHGHVVHTIPLNSGQAGLAYSGQAVAATALFSPGEGRAVAHTAARLIASATRRLRIATPVLTNGAILGALADAVTDDGLDIVGVHDQTQMRQVQRQWSSEARTAWKTAVWQSIMAHGDLAGKRSTPYGRHSLHDFMHAKILVADDTVLTGSYNLSNNGRENAENVLLLPNAALADLFATYVETVAARYRQ